MRKGGKVELIESIPVFFKTEVFRELAAKYGTPLFVYSKDELQKNCRHLQNAMKWNDGFKEFFPVSAMNNPRLLRIVHQSGCGVRCINEVEMRLAQMAGIPGEDILFAPYVPSFEDWETAISCGATIVLDCKDQLEMLPIERYGNRVLGFGLNLSSNGGSEANRFHTSNKAGMFESVFLETLRCAVDRGFKRIGLHLSSVQKSTEHKIGKEMERMLALAKRVRNKYGVEVEWCDMGCCLPYSSRKPVLFTPDATIERIRARYEAFYEWNPEEPRIPVYLGAQEHIAASAGVLLTRVRGMKYNVGTQVGLDTSVSDLVSFKASRDRVFVCKPGVRIRIPSSMGRRYSSRRPNVGVYFFTGKTPDNNDRLYGKHKVPILRIGDVIVIQLSGSRCRSASDNYHGNLRSPEVLIDENGPRLISRRETFEDLIRYLE